MATTTYCTLAEVKSALRITDNADDTALTRTIKAASRRIDQKCNRRFWIDDTVSARTYAIKTPMLVLVDDIATTTGLIVEVDTTGNGAWSTLTNGSDYQLEPLNALAQGFPVNTIRSLNTQSFPTSSPTFWPTPYAQQALMRVTAKWGFPTVPDQVVEACIMLSARQFRRLDSPLGVAGFGEMGVVNVRRFDPDIDELLAPFVIPSI